MLACGNPRELYGRFSWLERGAELRLREQGDGGRKRGIVSVGGAVNIGAVECPLGSRSCGPAKCRPTGNAGWSRLWPTAFSWSAMPLRPLEDEMTEAPALPLLGRVGSKRTAAESARERRSRGLDFEGVKAVEIVAPDLDSATLLVGRASTLAMRDGVPISPRCCRS